MLELTGLEVVGFIVDHKKFCTACFRERFHGQTIRFLRVRYAVQLLSDLKNCHQCKCNLLELFKQEQSI